MTVTRARAPAILIVEDERTLGHLLIRVLRRDGYEVVWVSGEAGLRAAKRWGKTFDLFITNSRGAGAELTALINALFPGLPVLRTRGRIRL